MTTQERISTVYKLTTTSEGKHLSWGTGPTRLEYKPGEITHPQHGLLFAYKEGHILSFLAKLRYGVETVGWRAEALISPLEGGMSPFAYASSSPGMVQDYWENLHTPDTTFHPHMEEGIVLCRWIRLISPI